MGLETWQSVGIDVIGSPEVLCSNFLDHPKSSLLAPPIPRVDLDKAESFDPINAALCHIRLRQQSIHSTPWSCRKRYIRSTPVLMAALDRVAKLVPRPASRSARKIRLDSPTSRSTTEVPPKYDLGQLGELGAEPKSSQAPTADPPAAFIL